MNTRRRCLPPLCLLGLAAGLALLSSMSHRGRATAQDALLASGRPDAPTTIENRSAVATVAAGLEEGVTRGATDCARGLVVVRADLGAPDGEPGAYPLVQALLAPTLTALRADPRFGAVHLATFRGADGEGAAQAHRLGYSTLVDLEIRAVGPELRVEGSVFSTGPVVRRGSISARAPTDVSVRRFVGFPPLVTEDTVVARSASLPSRGYVALAAHDLDGDGADEIVAVRPDGVEVLRPGAGRVGVTLEELGRASWPDDVARAPAPRRRRLATAVGLSGQVIVRLSDHAAPVRVALVGGAVSTTRADGPCPDDRFAMSGRCARLVDGRDFFDQVLTHATEPDYEAAGHFYVHAEATFQTREETPTHYAVMVTPHGRMSCRIREHRRVHSTDPEIDGTLSPTDHSAGSVYHGTALAIADLDLDGAAELLASRAAPEGSGDQLILLRAQPRGTLRVVWRSEAIEGSVWLATAGDIDGDGLAELLAIEEPASGRATLWIVR